MSITLAEYREKVRNIKTPDEKNRLVQELLNADLDALFETAESRSESTSLPDKILALKSKGMTTGGIQAYLKEADGVNVSRKQVSIAMDEILPQMNDWLTRPLSRMYPIVFLDGMRFPVKDSGKTVSKCSYHMIGINPDGVKELLGFWISDSEGAKFWNQVLADIRNRGVEDILIACIDGLKGFPQAIEAVYPHTTVQLCINHLTRSTSQYVRGKRKEEYYADLKKIYNAPTEEAGYAELQQMKKTWSDFAPFLERWEKEWPRLSAYFSYSPAVRRLIYTTNHVESLHSELRRVTKAVPVFPNDEYLRQTLWLAQRDITRKWIAPISDWGEIVAQLSIQYPERVLLY